jgi:hypothetical protein
MDLLKCQTSTAIPGRAGVSLADARVLHRERADDGIAGLERATRPARRPYDNKEPLFYYAGAAQVTLGPLAELMFESLLVIVCGLSTFALDALSRRDVPRALGRSRHRSLSLVISTFRVMLICRRLH